MEAIDSLQPGLHLFMLEARDRDQLCVVLESLFHIPDLDKLRRILGDEAEDDPELQESYMLDEDKLARIISEFDVKFDPCGLAVTLYRWRRLLRVPYLVHTGYELPLLLEGRKKLARMGDAYPPMTFDGEDRFDHWVAQGVLHREEVIEPFDRPTKKWLGHRTVYYTPKGEEWRIPASKLVWEAAEKSGGWNEHFERLEGMLFGYEDWQNDWWINERLQRGDFGGSRLCCAVTSAGLAWIEAAGFRALPPIDKPTLAITSYNAFAEADMRAFMLEDAGSAALVRFNVFGGVVSSLLGHRSSPPWHVPSHRISELNRNQRRAITIVLRRDG
ncbi:MAG: hypothetical protein WBQ75_18920 [Acetobacteraceae bacterium]